MEIAAAALLGSTLAVGLASIGPAIGIGYMTGNFFQGVSRQPEVQGNLQPNWFIALGMVELLGLFGFVTFFMVANGVVEVGTLLGKLGPAAAAVAGH